MPPQDRERIFERLIRLDTSRSRPGHGLGLSMVEAIALAHGGTARVVPGNQGLAIDVGFPALTAQSHEDWEIV
ncbi:ATP-binding protein [Novosphingobium clariflavum]|uniref:histidine kinase n=1 Tax=Novosphingobium clariflavum TaxID=2029884 RepID=A0ABV6SAV8_9SPHN|nr:ATP-binding protein [Novosphingobium clariflavum]